MPLDTLRLRKSVRSANKEIARRGLAPFTFGNASAIDRAQGIVAIKPSGVPYDELRSSMIVITDLTGKVVDGTLKPSSDLATHLEIYKAFDSVGGVVHTHSHYATAWAQAGRSIPCFGTTHADYFDGGVPLTASMSEAEIATDYEANTGRVIVRRFDGVDPLSVPAVLVNGHAPFSWGATVEDAVEIMSVLEEIARLAFDTLQINSTTSPLSTPLRDKHFKRKHGASAYYGQG